MDILIYILFGLSIVSLLASIWFYAGVRYGIGAYPPGIGEWQQNVIDGFVNKALNKQKWMDEWVRHYDRRIAILEEKAGVKGEPTPYPLNAPAGTQAPSTTGQGGSR